jgi:hypothetical protein
MCCYAATYFGLERPSSGNTYIEILIHCTLIIWYSLIYVVEIPTYVFELRLSLFHIGCDIFVVHIKHCLALIT